MYDRLYIKSIPALSGTELVGREKGKSGDKEKTRFTSSSVLFAGSVNSLSGDGAVLGRYRLPDGHIVQQRVLS